MCHWYTPFNISKQAVYPISIRYEKNVKITKCLSHLVIESRHGDPHKDTGHKKTINWQMHKNPWKPAGHGYGRTKTWWGQETPGRDYNGCIKFNIGGGKSYTTAINRLTGRQHYGQNKTKAEVPLQHCYKPHEELAWRFPYLSIGQEIIGSQWAKWSEAADNAFMTRIAATQQINITNSLLTRLHQIYYNSIFTNRKSPDTNPASRYIIIFKSCGKKPQKNQPWT